MNTDDLPKALSEEERRYLVNCYEVDDAGEHALALIDALTERLAEAVARMTVAERRLEGLTQERDMLSANPLVARVQAAEAKVRELEAETRKLIDEANAAGGHANTQRRKAERLRARAEAAEAKARDLDAENHQLRQSKRWYEVNEATRQQLIAANALLERCNGQIYTGDADGRQLAHDIRAHLAGQPAEPSRTESFAQRVAMAANAITEHREAEAERARTEAEKAVLDAMGRVSEHALRVVATEVEWVTDDLSAPARAELARRGMK